MIKKIETIYREILEIQYPNDEHPGWERLIKDIEKKEDEPEELERWDMME